jgi:hypothetical protein
VRDVSQAWRDTVVSGDITVVETAHLLAADGSDGLELKVTGGSVNEDSSRTVRTDFDLTVVAEVAAKDLPGQRVRIARGFQYPDGTTETVTLATGFITHAEVRSNDGTISISGMDRTSRLQRPSLLPVTIPAGRNAAQSIRDLLSVMDPSITWDLMETAWTLPRLVYAVETDLMAEAVKLALSFGAQVFATRDDHMALRPVATAEAPERYTFTEDDRSTFIDGSQGWDIDQIPNGVIGISQHSSLPAPIRAEVWQAGVTPDGPDARPFWLRTSSASTQGQLQAMVNAKLQLVVGGAHEITMTTVADPSLEVDDVARARNPSIGADDLFVVSRVGFTLGGATMEVTARSGVASD